jgi:hypothetical protein
MKLDAAITEVHEKYWDAEKQAAIGKTVLLVEGEDDRGVVEAVLEKSVRGWATHFRIVAAGGFKKVIGKKTLFPRHYLLIDRDTRTDEQIATLRSEESSLYVTEGWCIENLFLAPTFVATLGDVSLTNRIEAERERWVRAGALWWTLQRAREASQRWWDKIWPAGDYGMPRDGCEPASAADFRAYFAAVAPLSVDIASLAREFEARLEHAQAMSPADQWRVGVHGKAAFNHLFAGTTWDRRSLAGRLSHPLPAPLGDLLALVRA